MKISPLFVGVVAIALSYYFYLKRSDLPKKMAKTFKIPYKISLNKWYFDEIYEAALVVPAKKIGDFLWRVVDVKIIDRFGPNGVVSFCANLSKKVSKLQTGFIYHYATWMVVGCVLIISYLLFSLKQFILL